MGWLGSCAAGGSTGLVWRSPRASAGGWILLRAGPCMTRALSGMATLGPAAVRAVGGCQGRGQPAQ